MFKKFFLVLLALFILIPGTWGIYAYLYHRIPETEARNIALGVIRDYYSNYCNGGFEKDLTVKINGPNSKYEYDSDNGYCSIFVDVDEYGAYKRGSRDNGAYVSSGDLSQ